MIARSYEISCDNCGCVADGSDRSIITTRINASEAGWHCESTLLTHGVDLCPDCKVDPDITGIDK